MRKLLFFVLVLLIVSVAAKKGKKGKQRKQVSIEILSKGKDFVHARFSPVFGKKRPYHISVNIYNLADVRSAATMTLKKKELAPDAYHHIDVEGELEPGTKYEIYIGIRKDYRRVGSTTFFTDCDEHTHQCNSSRYNREICLEKTSLCNGDQECSDGSDEVMTSEGCKIKLPDRAIPPPPPSDAPCIIAKNRAIAEGRDFKSCEADGSYSSIHCVYTDDNNICHCLNKETGKSLMTEENYDYFTGGAFRSLCEELRKSNSRPPLPPPGL